MGSGPVAVAENGNLCAVFFDARNGQVVGTDHEIHVNDRFVQAVCLQGVVVHVGTTGEACRIGFAQCQVTRRIFVKEGFIKEDIRQGNRRMVGNEGYFA